MQDFHQLYGTYREELYQLGLALRGQFHKVIAGGCRATFGDVEGEILYMLIRPLKPKVVFELSPDCGWSTNYILAALTANEQGDLHSFEPSTSLRGQWRLCGAAFCLRAMERAG